MTTELVTGLNRLDSDIKHTACPESCRDMWVAVIKQALFDATFNCLRQRKPKPQSWNPHLSNANPTALDAERARLWFFDDGPDFRQVCWHAGFDPDKVRENCLRVISECNQFLPKKYHFKAEGA